jgi:DMSO/TMAO reductase YedYZ molybdopterin-dependent catalytic subunit
MTLPRSELSSRRLTDPSPPADTLVIALPSESSDDDLTAGDGFIVLEDEPRNLESPVSALRTFVTPTDAFYVRNHFAEPEIDIATWRLTVEGHVERTIALSYHELLALPSRSVTAMLECAGNGRAFLDPKEHGAQWAVGAAGNAEWTGVPLRDVLERAGLAPNAVAVILEGADKGEVDGDPRSPGAIHYAHSLPVTKACGAEVLLAYQMNGAALSRAHGFPLRVIVPGWYGMVAVKWLQRLVVTDRPVHGFFESVHYTRWERPHGTPTLCPITEMHVKAVVVDPEVNATIVAGAPFTIKGLAWTGDGTIAHVEVSVDDGRTWTHARLTSPATEHVWRAWECEWTSPAAGRHHVMARATDTAGRSQPLMRDTDRRNYEITHVVRMPVTVRA